MQKILGHKSILTTTRYTHLTSHTQQNATALINGLIDGFVIEWGTVK